MEQLNIQHFLALQKIKLLIRKLKLEKIINRFFMLYYFITWILAFLGIHYLLKDIILSIFITLCLAPIYFFYEKNGLNNLVRRRKILIKQADIAMFKLDKIENALKNKQKRKLHNSYKRISKKAYFN